MEEFTMFEKMVKMRNKKGFTLMELLIVVAIIAILVAISIPVFTSQLEKAREQTDVANLRAAKAVAVATYLSGDTVLKINAGDAFGTDGKMYYDAAAGKLTTTLPTGYGKGTTTDGGASYSGYVNTTDYANQVITVGVDANGTVTLGWAAGASKT